MLVLFGGTAVPVMIAAASLTPVQRPPRFCRILASFSPVHRVFVDLWNVHITLFS